MLPGNGNIGIMDKDILRKILAGEHDFIKVARKDGTTRTLFAFSHVGYPIGKFALSHELAGIDANIVFVNTKDNSWYQAGAGDDFPTIGDLKTALAYIRDELSASQSYTVGMSMGGYAAALFGGLLEVDAVLAFTPEITIGTNHGRSTKLNNLRVYDEEFMALSGIISRNQKTVFNFVYGMYDLTDLALLWPIASKLHSGGNVNFLACSDSHKVPLSVGARKLVEGMLDHQTLQSAELGSMAAPGERFSLDLLLVLRDAIQLRESGRHDEFRKLLAAHASDRAWGNFFIAESFRAEKKDREAIPFYYRALAQDGRFQMVYYGLCDALEALGEHHEASLGWRLLIQVSPHNVQFIRRTGMNLLKLNAPDRAKLMFEKILQIKPDDVSAREQLEALNAPKQAVELA